jgi:ribosomal protein S14
MPEEPGPIVLPTYSTAARCDVCGRTRWYVRGQWVCKNCIWREDEAKAKEAKT